MHETAIKVRFGELDAYGHVNHAVLVSYLEVARVEALAEVGFGLDRLAQEGFHIVVVELALRFRRPARLGEVLTVETGLTTLRRASSQWRQRIHGEAGVVLTSELRAALTDLEGRPRAGPPALLAALGTLGEDGDGRPRRRSTGHA